MFDKLNTKLESLSKTHEKAVIAVCVTGVVLIVFFLNFSTIISFVGTVLSIVLPSVGTTLIILVGLIPGIPIFLFLYYMRRELDRDKEAERQDLAERIAKEMNKDKN